MVFSEKFRIIAVFLSNHSVSPSRMISISGADAPSSGVSTHPALLSLSRSLWLLGFGRKSANPLLDEIKQCAS